MNLSPAPFQADDRLLALGTVKHFLQNQPIYHEGDPARHFIQVVEGVVRSVNLLRNGRRYIEAFHLAGDVFGLESRAHYTKSTEAVCPCSAVFYPLRDLAHPTISKDVIAQQVFMAMQQDLQHARDHARLLSRTSAREKTLAFLLECSGRAGGWPLVVLTMNRQDIGDYLGLTLETVSRSLAQLRRDGVIEILSARCVRLVDVPGSLKMML